MYSFDTHSIVYIQSDIFESMKRVLISFFKLISYPWSLTNDGQGSHSIWNIWSDKTALNMNLFTRLYYKDVITNQNSFTPRILNLQ